MQPISRPVPMEMEAKSASAARVPSPPAVFDPDRDATAFYSSLLRVPPPFFIPKNLVITRGAMAHYIGATHPQEFAIYQSILKIAILACIKEKSIIDARLGRVKLEQRNMQLRLQRDEEILSRSTNNLKLLNEERAAKVQRLVTLIKCTASLKSRYDEAVRECNRHRNVKTEGEVRIAVQSLEFNQHSIQTEQSAIDFFDRQIALAQRDREMNYRIFVNMTQYATKLHEETWKKEVEECQSLLRIPFEKYQVLQLSLLILKIMPALYFAPVNSPEMIDCLRKLQSLNLLVCNGFQIKLMPDALKQRTIQILKNLAAEYLDRWWNQRLELLELNKRADTEYNIWARVILQNERVIAYRNRVLFREVERTAENVIHCLEDLPVFHYYPSAAAQGDVKMNFSDGAQFPDEDVVFPAIPDQSHSIVVDPCRILTFHLARGFRGTIYEGNYVLNIQGKSIKMITAETTDFSTPLISVFQFGEVIYFDPNNSPLINAHLSALRQQLEESRKAGPFGTFETLRRVKDYIADKVFGSTRANDTVLGSAVNKTYNNAMSDSDIVQLPNDSHPFGPKDYPVIPLEKYVIGGNQQKPNGICRHHAFLTAYFLHQLTMGERPFLEGIVQQSVDMVAREDCYHLWTVFIPRRDGPGVEKYHVDTFWNEVVNFAEASGAEHLYSRYTKDTIERQIARTAKAAQLMGQVEEE